jgi:ParB family chromosome partitioning protein
LALRLEETIAERAKENQIRKPDFVVQISAQQNTKTRDALAAIAGVSHDTVAKVKKIEEKASDEVKEKLARGEMSINEAHKIATNNVHVSNNSGENEWYTPKGFVDSARSAMGGIDVDPASCAIANQTVKATQFFTKEDDGLAKKWSGRVWLNPPYAQPLISQFCEAVSDKFDSGEIEQACVLVNNATETAWFQRLVESASALCLIRSRIKFLDPSGRPGAPLQGQVMVYFGKNKSEFAKMTKDHGKVAFL